MSFNFMAAVTICSDFEAQENKIHHCFTFPLLLRVQKVECVFWFTAGLRERNRFPVFPTPSEHPHQMERLFQLVNLRGRVLVAQSPRFTRESLLPLRALRVWPAAEACRLKAPCSPSCSSPRLPPDSTGLFRASHGGSPSQTSSPLGDVNQ